MAQGSEQFSWKRNWSGPRECSYCSTPLRVDDVGEVRRYYQGGGIVKQYLWCKKCRGRVPRHA